jgi:hypothetical protein
MTSPPSISAIIPARNEEQNIRRAVESLAAQPEIAEIIVVNDESSDATAQVLEELRTRIPKLRVIDVGNGPPTGWVGKNWAAARGAAAARGEWLLFTDADVEHKPLSAARALNDAAANGAELVSYSPEQEMRTWWERAVIPFVFCRLAAHYSYAEVSDPASSAAAANGQFLLIRKESYAAIGGHAAVSSEVVEDVAMAQRAKQSGCKLFFASGRGVARTRMYTTLPAMWEGWRKNLYSLVGLFPSGTWRELAQVVPWIPLLLLALGGMSFWFAVLGLMLLAGRHIGYAFELRRNRFPAESILYYLPGLVFYVSALLASALDYSRGSVVWKGRAYSVGTR